MQGELQMVQSRELGTVPEAMKTNSTPTCSTLSHEEICEAKAWELFIDTYLETPPTVKGATLDPVREKRANTKKKTV